MTLALTLDVEPQYVADFPMLAGVVLANRDAGSWYGNLPPIDPDAPLRSLVLEISPPLGPSSRIPSQDPGLYGEVLTLTLDPDEHLRHHVDLSRWVRFPPGGYRLELTYVSHAIAVVSPPVSITVVDPSPADHATARALLGDRLGERDAWVRFLEDKATPPAVRGLSPYAERALGPTLCRHRAIHGPTPLASIDPASLPTAADGPVAAELAVMRYEIAAARDDPGPAHARTRAGILKRWPGLGWRLDDIDDGAGPLTRAAERRPAGPPSLREP